MTDREPMKNDVPELWRQRAKAGLCPACGKTSEEFEKRMRVYCSPKCRDDYASKYTYWSIERDKFLKEQKVKRSINLDEVHWQLLEDLTPFYGSSAPEVVRNIVLMWLHDNLGSNTINELKENNAIKLGKRK